ncbi:hypothetical protein N7451_012000 [Penicillium sp. IBT 35674x]|nr:hypothetical protein N7451_012000 [Penicillium sp. IBT 35674x]
MQQNCGWGNITMTPANNYTVYENANITIDLDEGPVATTCPQTLNITGSMNLTCQEATVTFEVPMGGLTNLNNDLDCLTLINRTICAPLSCPITVIDINTTTIHVNEWVANYANFTLTQFLTWNPYIGLPIMANGDTVCSGPPGGIYVVPTATASLASVYTMTATPTGPVPSGSIPNCGLYYTIQEGDECALICVAYDLTLNEFMAMNPSINSTCGNLLLGDDYCVALVNGTSVTTTTSTSTSTSTTSSTSSFVFPPSETVTGTTPDCYKWYEVESGDGCDTIDSTYDLTLAEFIALNTYIDTDCSNLWPGYSYCVSGIPLASISSTTTSVGSTTTTGSVTTPTPTQTGMVSGCTEFYEAESGDGCWAIAVDHGITEAEFIDWNPAVGTDCAQLWPDYYYCIAV